jgi:hypothetical protein
VSGLEFEEPEPVEASHLVRASCCGCGTRTLSTPERADQRVALCGACIQVAAAAAAESARPAWEGVPNTKLGEYTPIVGYPNPYGRGSAPVAEREPLPEPEVSSRDAVPPPFDMPGAVLKLAETARESGWEVTIDYSRGRMLHGSTGRPLRVSHLLAVRLMGHASGRRAVAVYRQAASGGAWTWASVWMWGPDLNYFGHGSITELLIYIDNPMQPVSWFTAIRERVAARLAASRACTAKCEVDHEHKRPARKKAAESAL